MTLADDVKDCALDVNRHLGPNLREHAYKEALKVALTEKGIHYTEEATIPVMYHEFPVARLHPDIIVGEQNKYILELKVDRDGTTQLETYLGYSQAVDMHVDGGLMISFGETLNTVER